MTPDTFELIYVSHCNPDTSEIDDNIALQPGHLGNCRQYRTSTPGTSETDVSIALGHLRNCRQYRTLAPDTSEITPDTFETHVRIAL